MFGTALSWIQSFVEGRTQFVKLGQHQSSEVELTVGVPQGSVLGPILFAVYCSPVADVIADHGVRYQQYADDTQLHLAMCSDNTAAGLSVVFPRFQSDLRRRAASRWALPHIFTTRPIII